MSFCFSFSALAGERLDYTEKLYFTWARVPLGELTLTMKQADDHYEMVTTGKTAGIALLFNRHESTTTVKGVIRPTEHLPASYRSAYVDNGDKRLIAIKYDKAGMPGEETIIPPREESRPLVAQEAKRGAVDILTGFFVMRERLQAAMREHRSSFSVLIYDGKRLFRVDATIDKHQVTVAFHGITRPAIKLALQRVPLAGYKEKELRKMKDRNPPVALYVEPKRLVPFGLSLPVYGAKLEAWIKPEK